MRPTLDENKPIFQQITRMIEDDIVNGELQEGEQAPSSTQLVSYYKINPSTVLKGMNQLVDDQILYKKRGVGMFVAEGARAKLLEARRQTFMEEYIESMLQEAGRLGISNDDIYKMMEEMKRRGER